MNSHYDTWLVIKYLKLEDQISDDLSPILRNEKHFFKPVVGDVPLNRKKKDDGERGGSRRGPLLDLPQVPSADLYLKSKMALLKKTESFARLAPTITKKTDDINRKYDAAAKFYTPYIENHWELTRLYSVMRGRFRDDLMHLDEHERNSKEFLHRVVDLLILGSVLKGVNRHGLNVPRMTRMYLRDQKTLSKYLKDVAGLDVWDYDLVVLNSAIAHDRKRLKSGTLYVAENGLYLVRDSQNPEIIHKGTLSNINLSSLKDRLSDLDLKREILASTSKAGHTHSWESEPTLPKQGTQTVREDFHLRWNLFRLFWVRSRRFISLLALYWQGDFLQGFRATELGGTLFLFSYLAWLFFLPRLLVNLGLIYKHVFDDAAMTEVEKRLGWKVRLRAQLVRRWQELANDFAWFSSGITTCFFLANQIPAVGLYLAVAMQSYDLLVTSNRFVIEYRRLRKLKKELIAVKEDSKAANLLLADIDKRMTFDLIELIYSWVNFLVLLACAILMTQFFAGLSPLIPIVAALTTVAVTLVTYCVTRYIIHQRQKLYDGPLVVPDIRCVKETNQFNQDIDLKTLDLGIFASGYLRVVDSDHNLVNIIYANKLTEKTVDFATAFCWTKSRTLSKLDDEEITAVSELLKKVQTPLCQELSKRIDDAEKKREVVFTVEETDLMWSVCEELPASAKFDTEPAFKIKDLDSCLPNNKKFEVMVQEQENKIFEKLKNMDHDITPLKMAQKRHFWNDLAKKTSKSVYAFSGALLGTGGA